uniref:CSON013479 protein n=1 Tax=Culicoides sonorensis TaxID=179676 RepID=A0A336LNK5_CULSO
MKLTRIGLRLIEMHLNTTVPPRNSLKPKIRVRKRAAECSDKIAEIQFGRYKFRIWLIQVQFPFSSHGNRLAFTLEPKSSKEKLKE